MNELTSTRWFALPGVILTSVLPLALCLGGVMDIAGVILAYAAEGFLITLFVELDEGVWDTFRAKAALLGLCFLTAALAWDEMAWDPLIVVGIGVFVATGLVTGWWSARERELRFRDVYASPGSFFWRVAIVGMGLVGLIAGHNYEQLVDHNWTPAPTDGVISHLSMLPVRAAVALDVEPLVIPAVMLVVFKAVNEILYEIFAIFDDERPHSRRGKHVKGE